MSQIGQVQINFNLPDNLTFSSIPTRSFIIGFSQRGPIYKPSAISELSTFLDVFGQPTNEYEFDFFQAVLSTLNAGGVAICYRIPYADDKKLFDSSFEYYITDSSKIGHVKNKYVLQDYNDDSVYYKLFVGPKKKKNEVGLYLKRIPRETPFEKYFVLIVGNEYYKLYAENNKLLASKMIQPLSPEDEAKAIELLEFDYIDKTSTKIERYNATIKKRRSHSYDIGLYLTGPLEYHDSEPEYDEDTIIYDVIYKQYNDSDRFQALPGAKLTFTPINDFDSALIFKKTLDALNDIEIRKDCFTIREDIDPSQILGIFPILFAAKDADNLRQVNVNEVNDSGIGTFEVYDCTMNDDSELNTYLTDYSIIEEKFTEFEHASHFKLDWFETEIGNLIDKHVPQDLTDCKNSMGVAFVALYLDDEHKLDYKILESYYGHVGISTNKLDNLEDLVNRNSSFFHLDIDGEITNDYSIRALNEKAFIYDDVLYAPLISPTPSINKHSGKLVKEVNTNDIFSYEPENKYNQRLCKSLLQLHDFLAKTEFLNYSPFDYVLAPGVNDVLLLPAKPKNANSPEYIIQYKPGLMNIADKPLKIQDPNNNSINVKALYRLLALYTHFGDKGTIAFADIPYIYNTYIKDRIESCYGDLGSIKDLLKVLSNTLGSDILPNLIGSSGIYDKMYTTFNYQRVDKDKHLTRYHKFNPTNRFEYVPCSSVLAYAYVSADVNKEYAPIAGNRIVDEFKMCHRSYLDNDIQLFKALFDLYGITSLMNNKDNGTFPIQQTTWRNSMSVLKQLHAFRIYIAIRRQAYDICKSYLYESNNETNRNNLYNALNYMLNEFKEKSCIDSDSKVEVSATLQDIEQHQIQVQLTIGIYGAIVKIIVNLNLTDMKIEYIDQ